MFSRSTATSRKQGYADQNALQSAVHPLSPRLDTRLSVVVMSSLLRRTPQDPVGSAPTGNCSASGRTRRTPVAITPTLNRFGVSPPRVEGSELTSLHSPRAPADPPAFVAYLGATDVILDRSGPNRKQLFLLGVQVGRLTKKERRSRRSSA